MPHKFQVPFVEPTHVHVHAVVGVLGDDTDPMVTVMKLDKAPQETYADIGGLDQQIQEIKESVELPLTHPEYYEEMGIKPPKGVILYGPPGRSSGFDDFR
ncbi:26S proteasome regulatory subunit 4-like [Tigriopus californicus]|uniref:26S proteasome regulatory subunit 4-like n=1 Tax=Tigriopus californicus TaxID=6832 RepID=UPI0027DA563A|nr:26S proteasome regulatory subunit 4-like [Tigriopus californicus]